MLKKKFASLLMLVMVIVMILPTVTASGSKIGEEKVNYTINYYILDDLKSGINGFNDLIYLPEKYNEKYSVENKQITGTGTIGEKIFVQRPDISELKGYSEYYVDGGVPSRLELVSGKNELDVFYVKKLKEEKWYSISYKDQNSEDIKDSKGNIILPKDEQVSTVGSIRAVKKPEVEGYTLVPGQTNILRVAKNKEDNHIIINYIKN